MPKNLYSQYFVNRIVVALDPEKGFLPQSGARLARAARSERTWALKSWRLISVRTKNASRPAKRTSGTRGCCRGPESSGMFLLPVPHFYRGQSPYFLPRFFVDKFLRIPNSSRHPNKALWRQSAGMLSMRTLFRIHARTAAAMVALVLTNVAIAQDFTLTMQPSSLVTLIPG